MDFSQAFDMMPHGKLFIKTEKMGISTRAVKCVRSCLKERCQLIAIGIEISSNSRLNLFNIHSKGLLSFKMENGKEMF